MFNGIVETIGIVNSLSLEKDCLKMRISPTDELNDLKVGDSIAVNGICLTITDFTGQHFHVTVVPETLRKSNLIELATGSLVNLERSIKYNHRISGHYVQGHSDGVGEVIEITQDGQNALLLKIAIPESINKYIVKKGYIALDGMSITVIEAESNWISITLIPHTTKSTIAHQYKLNSLINIEVDIFGKYIEKIMGENKYASAF